MLFPIQELLNKAKKESKYPFMVTSIFRSLEQQAILWRQARTRLTIIGKCEALKRDGYTFLADILEAVGPQNGPYVTNACCGESWHNYGMAFDAYPLIDGKIQEKNKKLWTLFGSNLEELGLFWGGRWSGFVDRSHFQLPENNNPLRSNNPNQIKRWLIEAREICKSQ